MEKSNSLLYALSKWIWQGVSVVQRFDDNDGVQHLVVNNNTYHSFVPIDDRTVDVVYEGKVIDGHYTKTLGDKILLSKNSQPTPEKIMIAMQLYGDWTMKNLI